MGVPVQKLWKSNPKHAISIQNFVIGVSNALKNRKLAVYVMLGFLLEGGENRGNFAMSSEMSSQFCERAILRKAGA